MIHEILFHILSNLDGSQEEIVKIDELKEFLHPGEIELLKIILDTITNYHSILFFCNKIQSETSQVSNGNDTEIRPTFGLYIEAFATGVLEFLETFRNDVERLEEMYLEKPELPILYVVTCLKKHQTLFEMLSSIINLIEKEKIRGSMLMGRFHKYIDCGIECIEKAAEKITQMFNVIFYRELCHWVIYGDLIDSDEFFIVDGKCPDKDFFYPEEPERKSNTLVADLSHKSHIRKPPIVQKFFINWKMVPIFLKEEIVESILFLGRIVWVIRNDPRKGNQQKNVKNKDVWEGNGAEYYKKIQAFEMQKFNEKEFNDTIEECRIKLTKYLFSIILDEGNLKEHLQMIRDFYALGRGELFHQFLIHAQENISSLGIGRQKRTLNMVFMETARLIYGDNDKKYSKFELTSKNPNSKMSPLLNLQLNFEIAWPLHLIFTPKTTELYNQLFVYLLRLNNTLINLQKLWMLRVSCKHDKNRSVWGLLQKLTFLVNNLQYYFQVDVIEAQYSLLLKRIDSANDFGDIIKYHHQFISTVLAKTFVQSPVENTSTASKSSLSQISNVPSSEPSKVHNMIVRLLMLCNDFCFVASTWESDLTEPELMEMEQFQQRTDEMLECLLYILNSLYPKSEKEHLIQLLHLLDFNKYFTKTKPNLNLTIS